MLVFLFFFFKQKTAYEMRISDWSSDVCSSDLGTIRQAQQILFDQGMIVTRQGVGAFVVSAAPRTRTIDVVQRLKTARAAIDDALAEIGRASCRERVCQYV